jgi:hypothetical protein
VILTQNRPHGVATCQILWFFLFSNYFFPFKWILSDFSKVINYWTTTVLKFCPRMMCLSWGGWWIFFLEISMKISELEFWPNFWSPARISGVRPKFSRPQISVFVFKIICICQSRSCGRVNFWILWFFLLSNYVSLLNEFRWFSKSNPNLNFKCAPVWSKNLENIISRCPSRMLCSINKQSWHIRPFDMDAHATNFDHI